METKDINTQTSEQSKNLDEEQELEMEKLIMQEGIVSATGLNSKSIQVGIKGDPSLRDTIFQRKRYDSILDKEYPKLQKKFEDILLNRGIYRVFIAFNSGEIRTGSIFDPLREEIHTAEQFLIPGYIERHFPNIDYETKIKEIRKLYHYLKHGTINELLPNYWKSIFRKRRISWEPMEPEEIKKVLQALKVMRDQDDFYLRNVNINLVQSLIRLQFNCDGTQVVDAENFQRFLEENIP